MNFGVRGSVEAGVGEGALGDPFEVGDKAEFASVIGLGRGALLVTHDNGILARSLGRRFVKDQQHV